MGSISVSGTGFAAPIAVWAISLTPVPAQASPQPQQEKARVEIEVEQLRNAKGLVQLCLTSNAAHFPDCRKDPKARKLSLPAASAQRVVFSDVVPGSYALTLLHDENGNGRLDTFMGMPREGFGFSRNPAIRFGPPDFEQVRFTVDGRNTHQTLRVKYLL